MAFIGDAIVSKVLDELATLGANEIKQEIKLVVGVKDEVEKLTKNFQCIKAVLSDAEQKQWKEENIRVWLEDLKEVSYEMDDVLDEWRSAMLIRSQVDEAKSKLFAFIPSLHLGEIGLRHVIAHKIKDLNKRLDDIAIRKNNYGLISNPEAGASYQQVNINTISYIDMTQVKGRREDEEKIVNMLLTPRDGALVPHVVSIVGMGGLGKTTLAKLAFNNTDVEKHFEKILWVCVSDHFDDNELIIQRRKDSVGEIKVAKAILKCLGGPDESEMQIIVEGIKKKIGGKKFLLVLDDVWNDDPSKWENLKLTLMCGSPGSTVLVTTRKDSVSCIMGGQESSIFRPGHLSKEECWAIIRAEVALSGMTSEELEKLQDIGYQIADKCKGLPLAAKALGGLLRFKVSRAQWQSVLDSELWKLGEEGGEIGRKLFAPLWLSYYNLSPAERQCLSYCANFPKGSALEKKNLIKMWMAQGYLKEKTKDMKLLGAEYFGNLCTRSFFQDFEKGSGGKIKKCKMHDIVHDFVQFISKKECLCVERDESRLDSFRHLYYYNLDKFPAIHSFKKLRSLQIVNCQGELDLRCLFKDLTSLRSLALICCGITEIPSSVGKLIHLRLLDLRENRFSELPESVCDLCNLLILDLRDCSELKRLPPGIEKLSKLRYLKTGDSMIKWAQGISTMIKLTQGISRSLNALRKASFLVDGKATSMANLNNLNHLKSVHVHLRSSEDVAGAREAQLNGMKHLTAFGLTIDLEDVKEDEDEEVKEERRILHDEELIEALQPSSNLEKLMIHDYLGAEPCPSWLLSLKHLRKVEFTFWNNCSYFPPLGKLPSLTDLALSGHEWVRIVGLEFLGIEDDINDHKVVAFPKLENLSFGVMYNWEEWDMDVGTHSTIMPCLTFLSIVYCPRLKALPDYLLRNTKLKSLQISECAFLSERYEDGGVDRSKISHIPEIHLDDD